MLHEKDRVRLMEMRDHAKEALEFIEGKSRGDLDSTRWLNLSLVRLLEIIGEAAARVTETTQSSLPDIQWRQITGLRNRLIHGYNRIDFDILWDICKDDLPLLLASLEKALMKD